MKRKVQCLLSFLFFILFISGGCKKNESKPLNAQSFEYSEQFGSLALENGLSDVERMISDNIGGGVLTPRFPSCGVASIDSSGMSASGKIYVINYSEQQFCDNKESGIITFHLTEGNSFGEADAIYKITFKDFALKFIESSQNFIVNGTVTVANINGGYIYQANDNTIQYRLRGNLDITYPNQEVRNLGIYQVRSWTASSETNNLKLTITPDGYGKYEAIIMEKGKTLKESYDFETEVAEDLEYEYCNKDLTRSFVLTKGHMVRNILVAGGKPAYVDLVAGYNHRPNDKNAITNLVNDCQSNAFQITSFLDNYERKYFQLYKK